MNQPPSTTTGTAGSTLGNAARRAAAEAARRIQNTWRRSGKCDLPAAIAEYPDVLGQRSVFLDLAEEEFKALRDEWHNRSPSEYCDRFDGLARDLRSSLFRLIEVEKYLDAVPELGGLQAVVDWPTPGSSFAEFEVDEELGRGAIGRVYRCRQMPLGGRDVVVKVTLFPAAEAANLGRLNHPNVVPVHSMGTDNTTGLGWICMPYITRRTLADLLPGDPSYPPQAPLGIDKTLRMFRALADALDHIHRRGMLHGDLKPSNVLAPENGQPMLIDFNLAVNADGDGDPAGGTPRYMAPEQLRTLVQSGGICVGPASAATEAFSFAVVLAEVLLSKPPFDSAPGCDGLEQVARSLLGSYAERTSLVVAQLRKIDAGVAELVARCLNEQPQCRPEGFSEIRDSLDHRLWPSARLSRYARRKPVSAVVVCTTAVVLTTLVSLGLRDTTRVDADTMRLQGDACLSSADFTGAVEQYLDAWREEGSPRDLAMAAYCRNLDGKHKAAAGLYARAIDEGLRDPVIDSNYAASLLSTLRDSFDDQRSRLIEQSLLRAYGENSEKETVRILMLRHYLIAAQIPSRRRPDYPTAVAIVPEDGASESFYVLAARFLAMRTPDRDMLASLGRPLLEGVAALHGASAVESHIGPEAIAVYQSIDLLDRLEASSTVPSSKPPATFISLQSSENL